MSDDRKRAWSVFLLFSTGIALGCLIVAVLSEIVRP